MEFPTCTLTLAVKNFQIIKHFRFEGLDSGHSAYNLKFHCDVSGVSFLSIVPDAHGGLQIENTCSLTIREIVMNV